MKGKNTAIIWRSVVAGIPFDPEKRGKPRLFLLFLCLFLILFQFLVCCFWSVEGLYTIEILSKVKIASIDRYRTCQTQQRERIK